MKRSDVSTPPFAGRLNAILKDFLNPILKPLGFTKRKNVYVREDRELSWVIHIQRSDWNSATEASFTLNGGVYVPGVASTYVNKQERKSLNLADCVVYARIGMLSESRLDCWWNLRINDDVASVETEIGMDIKRRVENDVLPFLKRFETKEDVIGFLEAPLPSKYKFILPPSYATRLAYAAILHSMSRRTEKYSETINKAIKEASKSHVEGVRDFYLKLRDRLSRDQ